MKAVENPLLKPFSTPYQTAPFDKIKAEHFEPAFKSVINEGRQEFKRVLSVKEKATFQNTILPIEKKYDEISRLGFILFNLNSAETNPSIQAVTQKVSPMITRFMGKIMMNKKYFERVTIIYNNRNQGELTPEEIRLVEITWKNMKRNGANLNRLKKLKLLNIQMRLSKLNLKFNENVLAETNSFELHISNSADLAGLPDTVIEEAANVASSRKKKGWVFTLHYTSYGPFMKYCDNRELREKMYMAYTSRCNHGNDHDNNRNIREIVNLRLKQAKILGYANYAQYILEERMAGTPEKVASFIDELHKASKPSALKEIEELKMFAKENGFKQELMPWDVSYYSEKMKTNKFGFDEEMVKPYLKLENVIKGIFNLATRLYGLTFKEVANIPVYHPDVKTFEVYDQNGDFLSVLYTDFHPRSSKQGGAWMTEYRAQSNFEGEMVRPHISICGNFTKPTGDKPSLLTFNEVTTFLHEFGHALHGMLANTVYPSLSGTNVYRDFVELPSQIMENWATEIEWLSTFAFHYMTSDPMPGDMVKKLIEARNFQSGYLSERQLSFGMTDIAWHTIKRPFNSEVIPFEREAAKRTQYFMYVEGSSVSTSFSHIFSGGYAAGYYGYKWAEVLDADAFSVFKGQGIFNRETATRFRKEILEKGGTANPMDLYKNFRGKEPGIDALLERSGLK